MKSGTIFDNFVITDDAKEAEDIGKETWGVTRVCFAYFFLAHVSYVQSVGVANAIYSSCNFNLRNQRKK